MFIFSRREITPIAAAILASALTAPARAADQLDEIIVTAQKREESVQSVPIAISTLSPTLLQNAQITDYEDLQMVVPGLQSQRQVLASTPFLRGVGSPNTAAGVEPAVATYIDGVYMFSAATGAVGFGDGDDVERIEVLKGPQGTLFGRNATGGLMQIITKDPSQQYDLKASLQYGNYQTVAGSVYVTGGVSDTLATNIYADVTHQNEGYGVNLYTGRDINSDRQYSLRNKWLWQPSSDTRLVLSLDYSKDDTDGAERRLVPGALGSDGVTRFSGGYQDIDMNLDPFGEVRRTGGSLTLNQQFEAFKIVNITAYRNNFQNYHSETSGTPNSIVGAEVPLNEDFFSEEFQVLSNSSGPLNWIGGLFYMHADANYVPVGLVGSGVGGKYNVYSYQTLQSWAEFGQVSYDFGAATTLTLGARWIVDEKSLNGRTELPNLPWTNPADAGAGQTLSTTSESARWQKPIWHVALDHRLTDDSMIYATYNRGFRSGILQSVSLGAPPAQPESVDAFEVGSKTEWLDHTIRFNPSAFYYKYTNLQLPKIVTGGNITVNAAKATIYGVDADADFVVSKNFSLRAAAEWLHAVYSDYPNGPEYVPNPLGGNIQLTANLSGNEMIRAPKLTASVSATYKVDTSIGTVGADATYYYNNGFYWEPDNRVRQPAYDIVNSDVFWTDLSGKFQVRLFARNLFNAEYAVQGEFEGNGDLIKVAPPRTYGIGFRYSTH
jgi:iron complex outermembrane receptor protein